MGCGGGIPIAKYFLEQAIRVTGIDASLAMVELCRSRFPQATWHVADMRSLDLKQTFHGIVAWDSFFHLHHADQHRVMAIFARHAAPGAPLLITSGTSHGEAIGIFHGAPLYHASLSSDEYYSLLQESGFAVRAHVVEDPQCYRTVWLAQRAE